MIQSNQYAGVLCTLINSRASVSSMVEGVWFKGRKGYYLRLGYEYFYLKTLKSAPESISSWVGPGRLSLDYGRTANKRLGEIKNALSNRP